MNLRNMARMARHHLRSKISTGGTSKPNHTKLILKGIRKNNGSYTKTWTTVNGRKINASPNNHGYKSIIKINGVNYRIGNTVTMGGNHMTHIKRVGNHNAWANAMRGAAYAPGIGRFSA